MCLLIVHRAGATVPESALRNGWNTNHDGAGYAFVREGRIIVRKPFNKLKTLCASYSADRNANPDSPFLVHLRFATHGGKGADNIHPFEICGGAAVIAHNGMLWGHESPHKDESDTRYFARTVLAHRSAGQVLSDTFGEWLGLLIGKSNKFGILGSDGSVSIVNEAEGDWDQGVWYSNSGYKAGYGYLGHGGSSVGSLPWWTEETSDQYLADSFAQGESDERRTNDELYDLGHESARTGERVFDADDLTDEEWQEFRRGFAAGLAEVQGSRPNDEQITKWELEGLFDAA